MLIIIYSMAVAWLINLGEAFGHPRGQGKNWTFSREGSNFPGVVFWYFLRKM